jgi:hypothetical protein
VIGGLKMKKLLVGSAAIALGLALVSPAQAADGVKLGIGGYMKGYVGWANMDEDAGDASSLRSIDIVRDTEVHFTGETTLDNGLTVGFHTELADDMDNTFNVDESYAYFSGGWGRVNFGGEDGAAYLLQVAAPAADSNIDGLRQYVDPFNYSVAPDGVEAGTDDFNDLNTLQFDYAQDATGSVDKITYLTPVFSGFQAGVSYTPDVGSTTSNGLAGFSTDEVDTEFGDAWDVAIRYAGQFDGWGLSAGGGYTTVNVEEDVAPASHDDRDAWNLGANVNFSAFNVGAAYTKDTHADGTGGLDDADTTTWVAGADYTTGPFKLGLSYMDREDEDFNADGDLQSNRYSGGVTYTYGPGMTFRGSVHHVTHELDNDDMDGTAVLLGTQIDF